MRPKFFRLLRQPFGLIVGRRGASFTLILLSAIALIAILHPFSFRSPGPAEINAEADRMAWRSNWEMAGQLYARAERFAIQKGDRRDQLYAECGALRSHLGLASVSQASANLTRILDDPIAARDDRLKIRCLATQGDLLREDHPASAAQAWQAVETLAERLNDVAWQARAKAELGIIEFMNGNTGKARSLIISVLMSALARADLPTLVTYGSLVGNGLVEMGRGGEALDYCNATLGIAHMVHDIGFPYLAYGCKARALALLGRPDEARQLLEGILLHTRQLHMPLEQSQILVVLGQVAAAVGDRAAATRYFESAGSLAQASGFVHSLAWSMYEAAKVYRDEGRYADAERCEMQAMTAMRQVADEYHLPLHLAVLADLQAKEGNLVNAKALYGEAEEVTDNLLMKSPNQQVESSLIATMSDVYRGHFGLAARLGQTEEAFKIVETARGRSMADLLRQPRSQQIKLSQTGQAAEAEFSSLQQNLPETPDRSPRTKILENWFVADQVTGVQSQAENATRNTMFRPHPIDLAELRKVLLPGETVLEYVLSDPTSFCMVIEQTQASIVALPASGTQISEAIARYLDQIQAEKYDDKDARRLFDLLLSPVSQMSRSTRWTVMPDAALWHLPIETLRAPDGRYALESHTISYAPSSTVLYYLRSLRRPIEPHMAFLGVGAVPYDLEPNDGVPGHRLMRAVSGGLYDLSGGHLFRLPASGREVERVGEVLNRPTRSVLLFGKDATESKLKSEPLANFKIIHFAVHGLSDPEFPDRAALVLGQEPHSKEDGLLQLREIVQLSLSADLVTLSACDTAKGKLEGEEGSDGLAEAFLLAGAKGVVAALWGVDDSAAETLMTHFYTHLAQGQPVATALRQSKLDYLRKAGDRPPVLWAAFTLVGDGSKPIIF
jgi:CHAT domain-containing protein/tetratricopeptide (TPR) repeat protein